MALPGIIYLDAEGKIQETFFEDSYAQRPTPGTVLANLFPDLKSAPKPPEGQDYVLSQTGSAGIAGSQWELVVEFPLPEGWHLYAPGNPLYKALELELESHPMFEFGEPSLPPSETLEIEALGETVEVYSGLVQLRVPLTVKLTDETKALKEAQATTIQGQLSYQICTDSTCFRPRKEKVSWQAEIRPLDRIKAR